MVKKISKSLNRNPNNVFLRTKFYQLRKVYGSLCRKLKHRYGQQLMKKNLKFCRQQTLITSATY